MDRYELTMSIGQLNKLVRARDYENAAVVADKLEWRKIRQWNVLSDGIDAYVNTGKYDKARNVCVYAYNRRLGGKRLLATLADMYIKLGELEDANEIYEEFLEMAPKDSRRHLLLYKLKKAQNVPAAELIDILKEYVDNDLDEEYLYELALLYSEAGMKQQCVKTCDEIALWFGEGVYVEKALRLKKEYAELTPAQEQKLAYFEELAAKGISHDEAAASLDESDEGEEDAAAVSEDEAEDIKIKVPDYSVYDTRNVQKELQANVEEILKAVMNREAMDAQTAQPADVSQKRQKSKDKDFVFPDADFSQSEPTKEIIISKRQWRKASRNAEEHEKLVDTIVEQKSEEESANVPGDKIEASSIEEFTNNLTLEQAKLLMEQIKKQFNMADEAFVQAAVTEEITLPEDKPEEAVPEAVADDKAEEVVPEAVTDDKPEEAVPEAVADDKAEEVVPEEVTGGKAEEVVPEAAAEEASEDVAEGKAEEEQDNSVDEDYDSIDFASIDDDVHGTAEDGTTDEDDNDYDSIDFDSISDEDIDATEPDLESAITAGIEKIIDATNSDSNILSSAGDYTLQPEERKYLEKYLYMTGMEKKLGKFIGMRRLLKQDGEVADCNVAIMGNEQTDKIAFAINLFKAVSALEPDNSQKLAKISADSLNHKGLSSILGKALGNVIIIENAGHLKGDVINDIMNFMESGTDGTTFMIVDDEFNINRLFADYPEFEKRFSGKFLLKQYTVNELVDIAKVYAGEKQWFIDDKASFTLFSMLNDLQSDDQSNIVSVVKEIIDNAGAKAQNRLGNRMFGKFRNAVLLKESDFKGTTKSSKKQASAEKHDDYDSE